MNVLNATELYTLKWLKSRFPGSQWLGLCTPTAGDLSSIPHATWYGKKKKKENGWNGKSSIMYGGGWWFSCSVVSNSCNPMDCGPPRSSVHGILQARILEWICHFLLQGIFLTLGSNPGLLHCRQILYWLSYKGSSLSSVMYQFSSVQSLSHVQLFVTPWTVARQASLSITNSQSPPKLMSIESVMPSNHLILSSPSPPAFNLSQHQGLFQWVSSSHQVAKVLEFQLQFFQWIFRTDFL